jgi:hypothetical protein
MYVLMPCTAAPLIMLAIALIMNNADPDRRYPQLWDMRVPLLRFVKKRALCVAGALGGNTIGKKTDAPASNV